MRGGRGIESPTHNNWAIPQRSFPKCLGGDGIDLEPSREFLYLSSG